MDFGRRENLLVSSSSPFCAMESSFERNNGSPGSIKVGAFLDHSERLLASEEGISSITLEGRSDSERGSSRSGNSTLHYFILLRWSGVRLSPLGTSATNWPTVPAPDDR
jgi:hypothetical protein